VQVDLRDVQGVLHLYCLSLAGTDIQVVDAIDPSRSPGNPVVCLPSVTARYDNRQANFDWLKLMATHQVAHLEFGGTGIVPLLGQVPQPRLAYDLFCVLEEGRLDARISLAYPGLRRVLRRAQAEALDSRRNLDSASPVTAVLELLARMGLGAFTGLPVPTGCETVVHQLATTVQTLHGSHATAQDTVEAAVQACDVLSILLGEVGDAYETPDPVAYRGSCPAFFFRLDAQGGQPGEMPAESSEQTETPALTMPVNVELAPNTGQRGQPFGASTPLPRFLQQLDDPPAAASPLGRGAAQHDDDDADGMLRSRDPGTFVYDEWDYQTRAYKSRWCLVKEHTLDEGELDCFNEALRRHNALLDDVKRQFEAILPEGFGRITRLTDGEDLDLNAALEAFADLRMQVPPDDKIYWRRHKVRRDVAVLFLLDMSASTAETLGIDDDPGPRGAAGRSKRCIIDLEKDSIALLMQALEAIGDTYGIYGFSGYGRDGVDFYVVKDLAERFDNRIKRRLDRVTPRHATRMGAAIRHAVSKLAPQAAATKILLLLSDGRPQDRGYSRRGTEKAYAVHDTHMALIESRARGITPFCLTVDKAGHDYLQAMCGDIGYEVLDDIAALPARLPMLYRALTT
jgi:hypothetical protein